MLFELGFEIISDAADPAHSTQIYPTAVSGHAAEPVLDGDRADAAHFTIISAGRPRFGLRVRIPDMETGG
jgi:hypothetical protein